MRRSSWAVESNEWTLYGLGRSIAGRTLYSVVYGETPKVLRTLYTFCGNWPLGLGIHQIHTRDPGD